MIKFFVKSYIIYPLILVFAFLLRIVNLGMPKDFVMDEAYYVPDGFSIFKYGYEVKWADYHVEDKVNNFLNTFIAGGSLVPENMVYNSGHPPLGKMLIGLGMMFFDHTNPVGWRIASVIFGTAVVGLTMLLAKIIFKRKIVTVLTGLFVAVDGLMIAMSRTAMLDVFLTFFVLLSFIFIALYAKLRVDKVSGFKPYLYAGLSFLTVGLASDVKWSGMYFAAGLFILFIIFEIVYRRRSLKTFATLVGKIFLLGLTYILGYMLVWVPWLFTFGDITTNGLEAFKFFAVQHWITIGVLKDISSPHNYSSNAFEWILQARPTALYYDNSTPGVLATVFTGANLIAWLISLIALTMFTVFLIRRKVNIIGWVLPVAVIAGWLPWIIYYGRTVFQFYTVVFEPYLMVMLAWFITHILDKAKDKNSFVSKMIVWVMLTLIFVFAALTYTSAVAIPTSSNLSGFTYYSRWMNMNIQLGLYDLNQMPPAEAARIKEQLHIK